MATKRFERAVPNDLWQIDATRVHLADGTEVWVVDALDDHAPRAERLTTRLVRGRVGWLRSRRRIAEAAQAPRSDTPTSSREGARLHGPGARR